MKEKKMNTKILSDFTYRTPWTLFIHIECLIVPTHFPYGSNLGARKRVVKTKSLRNFINHYLILRRVLEFYKLRISPVFHIVADYFSLFAVFVWLKMKRI